MFENLLFKASLCCFIWIIGIMGMSDQKTIELSFEDPFSSIVTLISRSKFKDAISFIQGSVGLDVNEKDFFGNTLLILIAKRVCHRCSDPDVTDAVTLEKVLRLVGAAQERLQWIALSVKDVHSVVPKVEIKPAKKDKSEKEQLSEKLMTHVFDDKLKKLGTREEDHLLKQVVESARKEDGIEKDKLERLLALFSQEYAAEKDRKLERELNERRVQDEETDIRDATQDEPRMYFADTPRGVRALTDSTEDFDDQFLADVLESRKDEADFQTKLWLFEKKLECKMLDIENHRELYVLVGTSVMDSDELVVFKQPLEKELQDKYGDLQTVYYEIDEWYEKLKEDEVKDCILLMKVLVAKGAQPMILNRKEKGVLYYFTKMKSHYLIDNYLDFLSDDESEVQSKTFCELWLKNEFDLFLPHTDWVLKNLNKVIYRAIEDGLAQFLNFLFKQGVSAQAVYEEGLPLLTEAVVFGHERVVKLLLDKGCDPTLPNGQDMTPLHLAAQFSDVALVLLLLEGGVSACITNSEGLTPLHCASRVGSEEVVRVLIGHGAKTNVLTHAGDSPAIYAQEAGHHKLVSLLIDSDYYKKSGRVFL